MLITPVRPPPSCQPLSPDSTVLYGKVFVASLQCTHMAHHCASKKKAGWRDRERNLSWLCWWPMVHMIYIVGADQVPLYPRDLWFDHVRSIDYILSLDMPFMWKASNPPWDPWALGGPRLKIWRDQTPHPEGPHPRPPARRVRPLPRTTQRSLGQYKSYHPHRKRIISQVHRHYTHPWKYRIKHQQERNWGYPTLPVRKNL